GGPCPWACPASAVAWPSERLLVVVIATGGGCGGWGGGIEAAALAAFGLLDLGGGPAEAGSDLVGEDLHLGALLAVVGLPVALLQPARDHHAGALGERLAHVLGQVAPADDVEEGDLLLPLVALLVAPAAVHRQAEVRDRGPAGDEPQLGVTGQVADQLDVVACHGRPSVQPAALSRPRRAASWSGSRI